MRKHRRFAAILTAGLLAVTPCVSAGVAFAGATDSYTISVDEDTAGYSYKAYQIFAGNVVEKDGKNVLSDITWATGFNSSGLITALKNDTILTEFSEITSETTAEQIADILKGITNTDKIAQFAKLAKKNVGTVAPVSNSAQTEGKYPINVTGSGYYLVEETAIPSGNPAGQEEVYSRFMLDVVGPATVTPKRDLPTLDKKITGPNAKDSGKANTVSIGDTVNYEIDTDMPDITGYEKYFYVINDTLATGLTFDPTSVAITINGNDLTEGTDYEVQTGSAAAPYTFQIVFTDFVNRNEAKDSPIVVTYNAILNEDADRTNAGNLNTANLTYSNNPNKDYGGTPPTGDEPGNEDPVGKTPDKQTKTYTANIKLFKSDGTNKLTGAKFSISGTSAKAVLINGTSYVKDNENGTYRKLKDGTFTEDTTKDSEQYDGTDLYKIVENIDKNTTYTDICKEVYVDSDGYIDFGGLGAGTYTITELVAPDGYNKLDPESFTITLADTATFNAPAWAASTNLSGVTVTMDEASATAGLTIVNKAGAQLPSTGGIGTKLFYLFGGMLAVGSGVVLVTKKRMANIEK